MGRQFEHNSRRTSYDAHMRRDSDQTIAANSTVRTSFVRKPYLPLHFDRGRDFLRDSDLRGDIVDGMIVPDSWHLSVLILFGVGNVVSASIARPTLESLLGEGSKSRGREWREDPADKRVMPAFVAAVGSLALWS